MTAPADAVLDPPIEAPVESPPESQPETPPVAEAAASADTLVTDYCAIKAAQEESALNSAIISAAVAEAVPVLSESDRRYLARRNAVESALHNVEVAKEELAEAALKEDDAKKTRKGKETALEAARLALESAISEDEAPKQQTLFDQAAEANAVADAPYTPDAAAEFYEARMRTWEERWETFLDQSIDVLQLTESLTEKLLAHDPSITSLRVLTKVIQSSEGHGMTVINGIGTGKADVIQAAFDNVQNAFLSANPQPRKDDATSTALAAASDAPTDAAPAPVAVYDFDSTFPVAVNPTDNERFDIEYHRAVINEAVGANESIADMKRCLADDVAPNGTPLSKKKRKEVETALGETQMQYDDGFAGYASHFGEEAATRLRQYVESKAKKKVELKGGLE